MRTSILPFVPLRVSSFCSKLVLTLVALLWFDGRVDAQTAPSTITGTAITFTAQSGTSPFTRTGSFRFLGGSDGVYAIVGLTGGIADSHGAFQYATTGNATAQIDYTASGGTPYIINLTQTTTSSGSYSIVSSDGNTTFQTGRFSLAIGTAPLAVDGYTVNLAVQYGVAPLATAGKAKFVLGVGETYTVTGTSGFPNSTGTYSVNNPSATGTHFSLTDSVAGSENLTLSWSTAFAGTYVADTTSGIQAGTFTASPPTVPVITSPKTAVAGLGQPFSYQIVASGFVESYNATNLPPGLSIDTSTGVISGTPTALGVTKSTISASNAKTGMAALTFTVKQPVTITFSNDNTFMYNGVAHKAVVTTNPAGEPVTFVYMLNGKAALPVSAGTYDVIATVDTATLGGSANGSITITPAVATVTLSGLTDTYTGKPLHVAVTTIPPRLPVNISYNGSATAPTAIGVYDDVVATITSPDYTGSATGTFTIGPEVVTEGVTSITGTTAVLNGVVSPKDAITSAQFDYGMDTTYGSTATATIGGANATVGTVTAALSGLTGSTPYHYRLEVTSAAGVTYGADHIFTTAKIVGTNLVTSMVSDIGTSVSYRVTAGAQALKVYYEYGPADGDYTATTYPVRIAAGGVAVVSADLPDLVAGEMDHYRLVLVYPNGTIVPGPDVTFTNAGFDTAEAAATGQTAPDTTGATWASIDDPAINDADGVAFAASLKLGSGTSPVTKFNDIGIWANDSTGTLHVVVRSGDSAPDTTPAPTASNPNPSPATFNTVLTPLYNDNAQVAFLGVLADQAGVASAANDEGVWLYRDGTGTLVARLGSQATGLTAGTNFSQFYDIGLTQSAGAVVFAGLTGTSTSVGVTTANNVGIFEGSSEGNLAVKIRAGDSVPYSFGNSTGSKTIKTLTYLAEEYIAASQTRAFNASGDLAISALFSDGTTGLVTEAGGTESIAELSGLPAVGLDAATWAAFGIPSINNSGHLAFGATLTNGVGGINSTNDTGLWAQDADGTLQLIAQTGVSNEAPLEVPGQGTDTGSFLQFADLVYNNNNAIAFGAVLAEQSGFVTGANDLGIYCNSTGPLQLVARTGGQAPGCPTGATFQAFNSLVLPDANGATNKGGVAFIATLNSNAAAGISEGNDVGIWAVDRTGTLRLVVRLGDEINGKSVTSLSFLPYTALVANQTRSAAAHTGDLAYLARLSDGSTAIFTVVYP